MTRVQPEDSRPVARVGRAWPALVLTLLLAPPVAVAGADLTPEEVNALLPPALPWSGRSESLVVSPGDPWITPSEQSGLERTPNYAETIAWLQRLADAAPELELVSIGKSHEGRDLWMVVAGRSDTGDGGAGEEGRSEKPVLLAHAGIHAGEIDGKDAGLMLLRDLTVAGRLPDLLDQVTLLFIPMLNPDGHERSSPYSRPNQRGPAEMGWRTNARNQNLNRDFTKLDTPEVRALLAVMRHWKPDLYLDLHVTDGADYQYDITFGGNGAGAWSPAIGRWIEERYRPAISGALEDWGHRPFSLVFAANGMDMGDGFLTWNGTPRYSNGYGDARQLPAILVENHSLKPYRQRVLGTYVLLRASLELLAREGDALRAAVRQDRELRPGEIPLVFERSATDPGDTRPFQGIRSERYEGEASGGPVVRWTGEPVTQQLPEVRIDRPVRSVETPTAYLLPPAWEDVARRLEAHGIELERLARPLSAMVEYYRLPEARIAEAAGWTPNPFEGRVRIDPGEPVVERRESTFPAGSWRIPTDQPLGRLAVLLLEPESPDSFLQWGFFLEIMNRTEYAESYLMEPLAQHMMAADPALAEAFRERLRTDEAFAASPEARRAWFYERTPYYDDRYRLYPVARLP